MTHTELLEAVRRLMPMLEQGLKQRLFSDDDAAVVEAEMAKLRLELEPELLAPPEGVDPSDTVTVLGERADGSRVVLGTMAISPEAKLRDLAREQFGAFDDFSDEADAFFLGMAVLAHVQRERPPLRDAIAHARERVTAKFGDFRDDEGNIAADAFYLAESTLKWMETAHPQSFRPA